MRQCQYCNAPAVYNLKWFRGPPGKPGPVVVPYCGVCSLKDALAKRGMTAPVREGEDYSMEPVYEEKPDLTGCFRDNPETKEGKYLVKRRDGTVVEWPSFVLGARDPIAAWALWFYSWVGIFFNGNWDYLRGCNRLSWDFHQYRKHHGLGDPGKGRHRKDDPATIAEMRRGRSG